MHIKSFSRILAIFTFLLPAAAFAFQPHQHEGTELPDGLVVDDGAPVRGQPNVEWRASSMLPQLRGFTQKAGGRWRVLWDRDRHVPSRLMGSGIALPGTTASAEKAEREVRRVLAENLGFLAPGATLADFQLVTNQLDRGLRVVAFEQLENGLPVRGGQLSVRIKNDRLFVIASEAIPNVDATNVTVDAQRATRAAVELIERRYRTTARLRSVGEPSILPLIRSGSVETRTVIEVVVETAAPVGRWSVFIDARSGAPVAHEQTLRFANGTLRYNAPVRYPGSTRLDMLAPMAQVFVGGSMIETDATGAFTWPGDEAVQVQTSAVGPLVRVINASGSAAIGTTTIAPDGEAIWNESANETADAQVTTFIASQLVKDYVRIIAPDMTYLASQLEATVNLDDECNAYSDGITINFFASSASCENTGRLPDVVFHEFGHSFHYNAIQRGAGRFDTALSEGASDYLAASMTNDSGMGRGFFRTDRPLRELDPLGTENMWPRDVGESHRTGIIFGGAVWDLRKSLIAKFGPEAGVALTDQLWYLTLQTSVDIPSTFVEILVADDDDGDLSNGSPNFCEINEAFALHGLADPNASGLSFGPISLSGSSFQVPMEGSARCPGSAATGAFLIHRPRATPSAETRVPLNLAGGGYEGELPVLPDGEVLEYRIEIALENGSTRNLPDNAADPYYQQYFGPVTEIFCTDFDDDPFANGWTHALVSGSEREGADDWQWGPTLGLPTSGDPTSAFVSDYVIGNDLGIGENWDGRYQGRKVNKAVTPSFDVSGFDRVRLQYRRWLTVEDGESDQATIFANDIPVWTNLVGAERGPIHHEDREWRFHDIDLTTEVIAGHVQLTFQLSSDRSLAFGGWTIDDFCIVGTRTETRVPACGDGIIDAGELCDDGNATEGDGCESSCMPSPAPAVCGNNIPEAGETCDDGNDTTGDGCHLCQAESGPVDPAPVDPTPLDTIEDEEGCGCRSAGDSANDHAGLVFLGLVLAFGLTRRRRV